LLELTAKTPGFRKLLAIPRALNKLPLIGPGYETGKECATKGMCHKWEFGEHPIFESVLNVSILYFSVERFCLGLLGIVGIG
jgi:hypothetical protein